MSPSPNKRLRLSGSFSPASPPYHIAKTGDRTKAPAFQPQTPISPPHMSSTSQLNGADFTGGSQRSEPTPPSTAAMSTQASQQQPPTNTFPTPASSVAGSMTHANKDHEGDLQMTDDVRTGANATTDDDVSMVDTDDMTRTIHNRHNGGLLRSIREGFERRNAEITPLFKLRDHPYQPAKPHSSENLIQKFGLTDLAERYRRKDPVTGEKINKLRKTYESHIKTLQLPGKNKPVKTERELLGLMDWPDEEWQAQKVGSKDVAFGLTDGLLAKLDSAVQMAPGKLPPPDGEIWKAYLAMDASSKSKAPIDAPKKPVPASATPQASRPAAPSPGVKALRPERANKKRSYKEHSFSGYGEGYVDDAESTGGEDNGSAMKKRRKEFSTNSPLAMNDRVNYNVGVVGGRR